MKKFIVTILSIATFFVGLGGLADGVGARFKSDERALELIRQARIAIGGEQTINSVQSLTITGRATKTFDFDGAPRNEQGEWELNLLLPGQISKSLKLRREGGEGAGKTELVDKQVDIVMVRKAEGAERVLITPDGELKDKKAVFVVKNDNGGEDKVIVNGTDADGKKIELDRKQVRVLTKEDGGPVKFHRNDLFRTTLSLLLSAPQGLDVTYTYAGEGNIDGTNCDIVLAATAGSSVKLYLDKSSHLPVAMSYQAPKMFMIKMTKPEAKPEAGNAEVKILRDKMTAPEMAEYLVKFADFRSVNGLQLPHRWTQTVGGKTDETVEISGYEINPANIADKFKAEPRKVFVRTEAKPQE